MKKTLALILAAVMALSLVACAKTPANGGTEAKGSVYYLNFKPEADKAWQDLAKTYTEQTGVEVKVVTAASGTYETTLTAEMAKKDAPTLFQCGNETALDTWKDYCLALDGTEFLNEMTTSDFNIKGEDGKTYCAGYCYEAFGIIVNTELLEKAGHSLDEIKDFDSLKAVADDIHARAEELGFDAFSSAGLEGSSSWRFSGHLANMPLYYEFRDDNVTEQPASIHGSSVSQSFVKQCRMQPASGHPSSRMMASASSCASRTCSITGNPVSFAMRTCARNARSWSSRGERS